MAYQSGNTNYVEYMGNREFYIKALNSGKATDQASAYNFFIDEVLNDKLSEWDIDVNADKRVTFSFPKQTFARFVPKVQVYSEPNYDFAIVLINIIPGDCNSTSQIYSTKFRGEPDPSRMQDQIPGDKLFNTLTQIAGNHEDVQASIQRGIEASKKIDIDLERKIRNQSHEETQKQLENKSNEMETMKKELELLKSMMLTSLGGLKPSKKQVRKSDNKTE